MQAVWMAGNIYETFNLWQYAASRGVSVCVLIAAVVQEVLL